MTWEVLLAVNITIMVTWDVTLKQIIKLHWLFSCIVLLRRFTCVQLSFLLFSILLSVLSTVVCEVFCT
jgi:hypothetical protein